MTEREHPHWKKILPWVAGGAMLLLVLALVLAGVLFAPMKKYFAGKDLGK